MIKRIVEDDHDGAVSRVSALLQAPGKLDVQIPVMDGRKLRPHHRRTPPLASSPQGMSRH